MDEPPKSIMHRPFFSVASLSSREPTNESVNSLKRKYITSGDLCIVTVRTQSKSNRVILTDSPAKYINDDSVHVRSLHWYQNKLPKLVADRNVLCVKLLVKRIAPFIKADLASDEQELRTKFVPNRLPKLDLLDEAVPPSKAASKHKSANSVRHIEDMFAAMRHASKYTCTVSDEKQRGLDIAAPKTSAANKNLKRKMISPLMAAFERQASRGCCKKMTQDADEDKANEFKEVTELCRTEKGHSHFEEDVNITVLTEGSSAEILEQTASNASSAEFEDIIEDVSFVAANSNAESEKVVEPALQKGSRSLAIRQQCERSPTRSLPRGKIQRSEHQGRSQSLLKNLIIEDDGVSSETETGSMMSSPPSPKRNKVKRRNETSSKEFQKTGKRKRHS